MRILSHSTVRLSFVALLLLTFAGCTSERVDGDTTIFTFAWWLPTLVMAAGALSFGIGVLLRENRIGWVLIIVGPIAAIFFGPSLWNDKVTLNRERFTQRTGLWFAPKVHDVAFADITSIDLTSESRRTRRGRSTSYYMVCHCRTGQDATVSINDLMKQGAAAKILDVASSYGIAINDHIDD